MALSERQEREARLVRAKGELKNALQSLPKSVREGSVLRAAAWKELANKAWQLLARNPGDAWKYEEALRELHGVASEPAEKLAIRAYGDKEQRKALKEQA